MEGVFIILAVIFFTQILPDIIRRKKFKKIDEEVNKRNKEYEERREERRQKREREEELENILSEMQRELEFEDRELERQQNILIKEQQEREEQLKIHLEENEKNIALNKSKLERRQTLISLAHQKYNELLYEFTLSELFYIAQGHSSYKYGYIDYINKNNQENTVIEEPTVLGFLEYYYTQYENIFINQDTINYFNQTIGSFFYCNRLILPIQDRKAHTIVVGSSGSGKSELLKSMLYRDIKDNSVSTVLIDPHGILAPQILYMRGKDHSKMVYINPTWNDYLTPILDPFDVDIKNERQLQNYLSFFVHTFEQTANIENTEAQKELLYAGVNAIFEMKGNMFDLYGLFNDVPDIYQKALTNTKNPIYLNILKSKWLTPQMSGTKSAILRNIGTFLADKDFRDFTIGKSTINLTQLLDNGYNIIFDIKGLPTPVADAIGRFITAQITNIALSRDANKNNKSIYLYIDEFSRFLSPSIGNILAEARKFGLHLVGALQTINGNESTTIINKLLANTAVKIAGQCDYHNSLIMQNEIGVHKATIQDLKAGNFWIKTKSITMPYQFYNMPFYIDDSYSVSKMEKEAINYHQLKKYVKRLNTEHILNSLLSKPSEEQTAKTQEESKDNQVSNSKKTTKKKPKQDDLSDLNFKTDLSL